jgi:hypothetical protein
VTLALLVTAWLAFAPSSGSAQIAPGLYIITSGPYAGVGLEVEANGEVRRSEFDVRGRIREPDGNCNSLHFRGRIEGQGPGRDCWRVVHRFRASRLLIDMSDALSGEEEARHVNNQKALDGLRSARRDLERAFDALERATRRGEIGEGKFERLKDEFIDLRRIDEAAEAALRQGQRQEARQKLERALTLKHGIVDDLPRNLLLVQPPDLKPMLADFVPAQSETVYTQRATNPDRRDLRYHWTLVEHNDFTCVNFEPNEPRENQAIWHHGDNQGCNHSLEGPNGHVGTISVIVRDGKFECAAFYNGSNDGEGPQPPRCEPVGPS